MKIFRYRYCIVVPTVDFFLQLSPAFTKKQTKKIQNKNTLTALNGKVNTHLPSFLKLRTMFAEGIAVRSLAKRL